MIVTSADYKISLHSVTSQLGQHVSIFAASDFASPKLQSKLFLELYKALALVRRIGKETIKQYLCFDEDCPSYTFSEKSPAQHLTSVAEIIGMWANRLDLLLDSLKPGRFPLDHMMLPCINFVADFKTRLLPAVYLEAYLINQIPPHSFCVGGCPAAVHLCVVSACSVATRDLHV